VITINTPWQAVRLYGVLFGAVLLLISQAPNGVLDWALFALLALGIGIEGALVHVNTVRVGKWTPTAVIIIGMRYSLAAYFLYVVGLQIWDDDRSWRESHEWLVYCIRAIPLVGILAELAVAPYRIDVDSITGRTVTEKKG
jgi:thiol:disulfide interchange protein